MKTWKKAGVTALAGSLVATSAFAGALTVSGSANIAYTGNTGAQDSIGTIADQTDGNRWGMTKTLSFAGSGEMDNGWTVSLATTLIDAAPSSGSVTLDMGDAGTLDFQGGTSGRGIGKIGDMMPTADEDVGNGIDSDGSGTAGGLSGGTSGGVTGFHYSKAMDMVEIGVGYAPKGAAGASAGGVSGLGATASATSAFIKIDPMDGLEIGFGVGEYTAAGGGDANLTDDVDTAYVSYVYGPLTVAYQVSNTDTDDSTTATSDDEQTKWGLLYAVNDEMSISYQNIENDDSVSAVDEEATGIAMSYTVGSMTFKAHRNKGTNLTNAAANESEHTELGVTFAF